MWTESSNLLDMTNNTKYPSSYDEVLNPEKRLIGRLHLQSTLRHRLNTPRVELHVQRRVMLSGREKGSERIFFSQKLLQVYNNSKTGAIRQ